MKKLRTNFQKNLASLYKFIKDNFIIVYSRLAKFQTLVSKNRFKISSSHSLIIKFFLLVSAFVISTLFIVYIYSITIFKYSTDDIYIVFNLDFDEQEIELQLNSQKVNLNLFDQYTQLDPIYSLNSPSDLFDLLPGRINVRNPKLYIASLTSESVCWNYSTIEYFSNSENQQTSFVFKKLTPELNNKESGVSDTENFFTIELDYPNFNYLYPGNYQFQNKLHTPTLIIYPIKCSDVDDFEINKQLAEDFLNFNPKQQRDLFNSGKQAIIDKYGKI